MQGASIEEIKLRRGHLLNVLNAQYPSRLLEKALERQVLPFYDSDAKAVARDLRMLERQGYIRRHEDDIRGQAVVAYEIEPAGIHLVEGSSKDPGIDFVRE